MDTSKTIVKLLCLVPVFSVTKQDTKDKESLVFPDYKDAAAFSQQSGTDSFTVPTIKDTDKSKERPK